MVTVRQDRPVTPDGGVDLAAWANAVAVRTPGVEAARLQRACEVARQVDPVARGAPGVSTLETGLDMVDLLAELRVDTDGLVAAALYRAVRREQLDLQTVRTRFGPVVAGLIEGVLRMAAVNAPKRPGVPKAVGTDAAHSENLRRMIVALVDDVRVALIKLAERTCAVRGVKSAGPERRQRVAREIAEVYAPLAHRLGIGSLRWELEDLSFRYLEPLAYRRIASLLKDRRQLRQRYIDDVVATLVRRLDGAGIRAEVYGRPKHICSIWRKMQRKGIDFDEVYDVRAVRILVTSVADCYGALGIVHALWRHIPHEFDDYIATPKENGYRSIHTAVIGPEGRTLEVQIRTFEMHDEAELGVCAHWIYKGGERRPGEAHDGAYEEKVTWLRQILEWQEDIGGLGEAGEGILRGLGQQRVYVLTRDGHVLDLPAGATVLDFAYRIHTEVGHRCRGARVDGRMVALDHVLASGQKVEILTDPDAEPAPVWLNPNLGYVRTARARSRLHAFFRQRDRARNVDDGRDIVLREATRMAIDPRDVPELADQLQLDSEEALYAAVGAGEVGLPQLRRATQALTSSVSGDPQMPLLRTDTPPRDVPPILGGGHRRLELADCCRPRQDQAIAGRVRPDGTVEVHRRDCPRLLASSTDDPSARIVLRWGEPPARAVPFDLVISAYDRPGLLFDVSRVFAAENIDVLASSTRTDRLTSTATIEATVELANLEDLGRVLDRVEQIPNVIDVRRLRRRDFDAADPSA